MADRMVWSGRCDECGTHVFLVVGEEARESEQEAISNEWPEAGECYVQECDGGIEWNGNDPLPVTIR